MGLFICAQGYLHHLELDVNEVLDCVRVCMCVFVCVSEMEEQEVSMVSVGSLADFFFTAWFLSFSQHQPAWSGE